MKLNKFERVDVTPELASRWKTRHVHSEWQRKLVEPHVLHLRRMMDEGTFLTGYVVFANVDGTTYCANGQHTIEAISRGDNGKTVTCNVEWYKLSDMSEYIKLFHSFDTENRRRTALESAQAFLMGNENLPEISPFHLDMFRKGVDFVVRMRGDRKIKATQYEKFDTVAGLRDELDMYVWLSGQEASRELLHRAPVIAAIVATYQVNHEKCKQFWKQVVTGFFDKQDTDDPCVKLHRFLQDNNITRGEKGCTTIGAVSREEMYAACIRAWNAYVKQRPLSKLQFRIRGQATPEPQAA